MGLTKTSELKNIEIGTLKDKICELEKIDLDSIKREYFERVKLEQKNFEKYRKDFIAASKELGEQNDLLEKKVSMLTEEIKSQQVSHESDLKACVLSERSVCDGEVSALKTEIQDMKRWQIL